MDTQIKQHMLEAPNDHLDASMKPLIEKWDDQPSSIQILEVLDQCIRFSLGSKFVILILQGIYDQALLDENVTHESNIQHAKWRKTKSKSRGK
jgi:hypothetical protein